MKVQLPDGRVAEFPDDMSREEVSAVLRKQFGGPEAVEQVGSGVLAGIRQLPRQLGLTARAGLGGAGDMVGVLSNPIAATINMGGRAAGFDTNIPFAGQTADALSDLIGLPKPETPTERVAQGTARVMSSVGTSGGIGGIASRFGGPGVQQVGGFLTQAPSQQVGGAMGGSILGESVKEAGGTPLEQGAASVVGTVLGGGAASGIERLSMRHGRVPQQVDVQIERMLVDQGVDWDALPAGAKSSLRREVGKLLDAGQEVDSAAVRRLADFHTVGATPTRGTVSLDPVQLTREKNLAKTLANTGDGELHGLPKIENENNRALITALNRTQGNAVDPMTAGQRVVGTIGAKDERFRRVENELYKRARDAAGRDIPLDGGAFVNKAFENLAKSNKGAFLPDDIGKLLQGIRTGKMSHGGQEFDVPFNVDVIDNLKTTLATASRGAKDGNVRAALKDVRDALEGLTIAPVKREFGGSQVVTPAQAKALQQADELPDAALRAFNRARGVARSRRTWQESSKGVEAALGGEAPDNFVRKHIIADGASFDESAKIAREIQRSPEARQAVRSAIVGHLKDKALSGASDEVGNFSQSGYNRALKEVGRKLSLFFTPEEIASLEAVGRVASYTQVQPRGSAVNNSNTAAMAGGRLLDMLERAKYVPFGRAFITDPLQSIRRSAGDRAAQNVVPGLLAGGQQPLLSPALTIPGVLSTGLLAPPALNQ